ncbi:Pycsar system effector family protein [Streptomyces rhizosphaericola]|uniref:Pycsar system effector family protein n=1 Tax=Streptomyces rhizosphaericola TaxID=2564098 RepID=UPI0039F0FAE4
MTTAEPQSVPSSVQGADAAAAMLRSELGRADSKASLLLALTGAGLAGIASTAPQLHLPTVAATAGVVGIAALVTSTVLLLLTVRPRLAGNGWPSWHQLTDAELQQRLAHGHDTTEVQVLAAAARVKFSRIRRAVDCTLTGVVLLVLATVLTAMAG